MAEVKVKYATPATITMTLDSLASSTTVGRESAVVDNETNLYLDALVTVKLTYPNSAPANHKLIYLFAVGYDGTDWTYPAAGAGDAAVTLDDVTAQAYQLPLLGTVPAVINKTLKSRPFSVAAAFGGVLPPKWALVALNYSGQTLGSGCTARYVGVTQTVA